MNTVYILMCQKMTFFLNMLCEFRADAVVEHLTAAVFRAARRAAILSPAEKVAYVYPALAAVPKMERYAVRFR